MSARVLHVAASKEASSGIVYQMDSERLAAQELGLSWKTRLFVLKVPEGHEMSPVVTLWQRPKWFLANRIVDWFYLRFRLLAFLLKTQKEYDVILLRYFPHDPVQTLVCAILRRKIWSVHHTKEIEELSGVGVTKRCRSGLEKSLGMLSLSLTGGVVAVTKEILDYEISRAVFPPRRASVYPNGVQYEEREVDDERCEVPTFLFVASEFQKWHGLDRLIEAAQACEDAFVVDLVGRVPDSLTESLARDKRFIRHGTLRPADIRKLATRAWVGLSSFALDRNQMTQASTLKVREYLQWGLPVIADYDDVFPKEFRYYRRSAANFESLLAVGTALRDVSRSEVREAAQPYISKVALLNRLAGELDSHLGSPCEAQPQL